MTGARTPENAAAAMQTDPDTCVDDMGGDRRPRGKLTGIAGQGFSIFNGPHQQPIHQVFLQREENRHHRQAH